MESFYRLFHLCVYCFQLNCQPGSDIAVTSRVPQPLFLSAVKANIAFLFRSLTVFLAFQCTAGYVAQAQMIIADFSAVTQDFNGIGSNGTATLPAGFRVNSSPNFSAANTVTTRAAGTSGAGILTSSSAGGTYNFASGVSATSTDRALGFLTSGAFPSPQSIMLEVSNLTGKVIGGLDISFDYEKYRSGTRAFNWTFFSSTDGTNWTPQSVGNQSYIADLNNSSVFNPPLSVSKTVQVAGLEIGPNEKFYLRWTFTGSGGSTNGQAIGVDNVSVTATELVTFSALVSNGMCPGTLPFVILDVPAAAGYKYDISAGTTYTGTMSAGTGGTAIIADPQTVTSFPTPPASTGSSYTFRVMNTAGQFKDTTVTINGIPDNCTPTCMAPPAVSISTADNCIKSAASLSISYVVQNGTALISSNGAGILASNSLTSGTGSVTYAIHESDRGKKIRFVTTIADPDSGGPCVAENDTIYIAIPPANALFGNIEVCEGGSTRLTVFGPGVSNTFTWDFEGTITGQGISQNPALANHAPVQTTGSGISVSYQGAGAGCSGAISSTGYSVTSNSLLSAIAAEEYVEFCAGSATGSNQLVEVTALNWNHRASGTGPMQFALVAADNPAVVLLTGTATTNCASAGGAISANPATCYRIYYWSATNGSGTLRIDNFVLTAKYKSPSGNHNFYTDNPSLGLVTPAATASSFDPAPSPGTTANVWVTALGELGCNSDTALVTVKVNPIPVLNITQPVGLCSPNTLQVSAVSLGATPGQGTVSYHSNLEDAQVGINALAGEQLVLAGTTNIYVRYIASGCYTTGVINALFYPTASLSLPDSLAICNGESTFVQVPNAAAPLVTFTWDFENGISGPGVSYNQGIASNGPAQTVGVGLNASAQNAGAGCSNAISANNFAPPGNSLATAVAANDYFEFCIGTAQPGFSLQGVTGVTWSNRASNTGPVNYALVASDNLTVPLLTGTVAPGANCETEGGMLPAPNVATCYRIYYWGPSTSSTGTLRIDDLAITAQYVGNLSYRFYTVDPAINQSATPVSTSSGFDPGTTPASSPDTLWVTGTNTTTGCVGPASRIIVKVRDCNARISDPCVCAGAPKEILEGNVTNKGAFSETVEITAPTGQIWRVLMVSGLFKDVLLKTLVEVGDTLKEALAGSGRYLLRGFHEDEKGYAVSASNGTTTLSIDNYCHYPSPTLSDVPDLLSSNFTPFTVEGGERNQAVGLDSFRINNKVVKTGVAPSNLEVRASMLTSGKNTLRYIFDAQTPSDKSLSNPGCTTILEKSLTIASCGCTNPTVTLNPATCSYVLSAAEVATGSCTNAIVRVMDDNPLNKDTIDCAGTFTYGLFDAQGNLICWGKVTAEDKSGPALIGIRGRCSSPTKVNAPNPRSPLSSFRVDSVSQVWKDTFMCMDVDKVYNVANSWRNTGYAWYAGEAQFQDACDAHGSCDCRNDVRVTDQLIYYPCTDVRVNQIWAKITRVFKATDCRGNETKVTQEIYFVRPPVKTLKQELALGNGSQGSLYGRPLMSYVQIGADGKLEVTLDSVNCTAPTEQVMIDTFLNRYYIFNDSLNCDGDNVRNDYSYFVESVRAGRSARLLECSYSFDIQQTATFPVCEGNGRKVEVVTNYFDWCTGVKQPLDTIVLKYYDNTRPRFINNAKEQVVISTGPLDCTASFGIDRASLLQYFGIDVQDNEGGCGIRDVSVKVESCVDSVAHGIMIAGRAWRSPEYQTTLTGGRRLVLGVPVGMHRLIVDATDQCYSQKRDTFYFRVEDKIAPVVKCTDQLNVTLSNTMGGAYGQSFTQVGTGIYGYARVLASQINAGTTDNCGLDWVRVRRAIPMNNALGLKSYYESLRNDPRFIDTAPMGEINKGDGYDWDGDGTVSAEYNKYEAFHDTLLPMGSSTVKGQFIMTPLLDWVDFFCSDYDQNVMIELWAKDVTRTLTTCLPLTQTPQPADGLSLNTQPTSMTSGGNMNYCWMNVLIEDKVAPTFIRPWDVTATCLDRAWLDTLALALSVGTLQLEVDNLTGAITSRTAGSNHAALYNYIEQIILSKNQPSGSASKVNVANNKFTRLSGGDCGRIRLDVVVSRPSWHCDAGQYRLTYRPQKLVKDVWQTYDGATSWPNTLLGGSNVTTITVEPVHAYDLRFPADVTGDCSNLRDTANVVDGGELGCDVLAVLVQDKRYNGATKDGAPVAECYKIFRTFTVVNWCQYDERCLEPMGDAVIVPRTATGAAVTVGVRDANRDKVEEYTYNGDAYTPARANSNTSPACGGSTSAISNYKGRNNGPEFYSWMYTQYILVHDTIAPILATTAPAGGWVGYQNKETCGGEIEIKFSAFDACAGTEIEQDVAGLSLERVFLNRFGNKSSRVAVPVSAISPVPPLLSGDAKTNRDTQSWTYKVTNANTAAMKAHSQELLPGKHSLSIVVRDDCGNLSREFDIPFEVLDTVVQPPICIAGLTTQLMVNPGGKGINVGAVSVWATDLIASPIYDCNGQGPETDPSGKKLIRKYYMVKDNGDGAWDAADSLDSKGLPLVKRTGVTFNCSDALFSYVKIRVFSEDEKGNVAYCDGYVIITDPQGICGSGPASVEVSGVIATEKGFGVEEVEVNLSGMATMLYMSDRSGKFSFGGLEQGNDYTITPHLDKDPLNGVSTYDLAMITRHVLSQQMLESPYQMIAADINNSRSITTLDIIQLRKLILGIESKFISNTSWRFVDAAFRFPSPQNPWQSSFPELINVNDIAGDVSASFVAVKIGDVSGNANVAALARSHRHLSLQMEDQVLRKGSEYRIPIMGNLSLIEGMQFTLECDPDAVELIQVESGLAKDSHLGLFPELGVITASWNPDMPVAPGPAHVFTVVVRAKRDMVTIREIFELNNRVTRTEAYGDGGSLLGMALEISGVSKSASLFELRQNIPNPAAGETIIGFHLPVAGEVTLTLSDVQGRVVKVVQGQFGAGEQQIRLDARNLPAGVLQYTLSCGAFTSTKRMLVVK